MDRFYIDDSTGAVRLVDSSTSADGDTQMRVGEGLGSIRPSRLDAVVSAIKDFALPAGYPDSLSPDYIRYMYVRQLRHCRVSGETECVCGSSQ